VSGENIAGLLYELGARVAARKNGEDSHVA
jgi:hypothetical protein